MLFFIQKAKEAKKQFNRSIDHRTGDDRHGKYQYVEGAEAHMQTAA